MIETNAATPAPRAARLALRLAVGLNLALALVNLGLWVIAISQGLTWRADFTALYTGWAMARDGLGPAIYDFAAQARYQAAILGPGRSFAGGLLPYVNPPHLTLPFVPLAWLPLPAAYLAWGAIQLALLALAMRLLLAVDPGQGAGERLALVLSALALPAVGTTLLRGNLSLLLLVALLLFYLALRGGRPSAGLWLAALTLKPQLAVAPGATLLGGRRWPALALAALLGAAALALTGLALGWGVWPAYAAALSEVNGYFGQYGIDPARMPNLRGLLTLTLGPARAGLINGLSSAALAALGLGLLWLWRGPWLPEGPGFALRAGLSLALGLFLSPHLYDHDLLLIALPAALLAAHLRRAGRPGRALLLGLPAALLLAGTALGPLGQAALLLALIAWLGAELAQASRPELGEAGGGGSSAAPGSEKTPRRRPPVWPLALALCPLWLALFFAFPPPPSGNDFIPLWLGGRAILAGQDPYSPAAQQELLTFWDSPWAAAGNAYPFPAMLVALPLAPLPLGPASALWLAFGIVGAGLTPLISRDWRSQIPLLMLFVPLFYTISIRQATLIWYAFAVLLLIALRRRLWPLAGLCIAVLPAKPQNGLLIALAALAWALWNYRPLLWWAAAWGAALWGGGLLLQPGWVASWLGALDHYRALVASVSLLPLGLLVILACLRLPWYALAAVAQVVVFPINDTYSFLPLLIAWTAIGGPIAWAGAALSWAWVLFDLPKSLNVAWALVLLPLCAAAALRLYLDWRRPRPASPDLAPGRRI